MGDQALVVPRTTALFRLKVLGDGLDDCRTACDGGGKSRANKSDVLKSKWSAECFCLFCWMLNKDGK